MIDYKKQIAAELSRAIKNMEINQIKDMIEIPPKTEMGDYAFPCFKLAKILKKSPAEIAKDLAQSLGVNKSFGKIVNYGPYVNFFVEPTQFISNTLNEVFTKGTNYGRASIGNSKNVVIDYSSPNIAKPFHVGHLRSTVIGNSLYKIYEFLGYNCIGINHLGDWGTQFGKQILAYKLWGDKDIVEKNPINELVKLYVHFHEEAVKHPELEDQARAWFKKLEEGDEEALQLWRWIVRVSLKEFKQLYQKLGVSFDYYTGESFYLDKVPQVIDKLTERNLLKESEGAYIVDLEEYDMPPCLILKSDGTTIYPSRDIAAALYRMKTFDFDKALYLTDYSQNLHFKQWIKVIELLGLKWHKDVHHIPFGRIRLPEGKMQTRKGNTILLKDVLDEAISKTKEIINTRNPDLPNPDRTAEQVGIGAIVFNDLYNNRANDVVFDWNQILSFEGETGPYVQYTYARSSRVLEKSPIEVTSNINYALLNNPDVLVLIKDIYNLPEIVVKAAEAYEPSLIARHLVKIAQNFNTFYHNHQIIIDEPETLKARLLLCYAVNTVLQTGLTLLGIESPSRM